MPARKARDDFDRLGALISGAEGSGAVSSAASDVSRLVAEVWPEVVGFEISANARPVRLRAGRLVVSTSSSAWAQTLHLMSDSVRTKLNERLGAGTIEQMVFRHAGWEQPQPVGATDAAEGGQSRQGPVMAPAVSATPVPAVLTPEQEAALKDLGALGLEPALEARIAAAMKAAFVRAGKDPVR